MLLVVGRSVSLRQHGRNESGEATGQCPDPFSTDLNQKNTPSPDMLLVAGRGFFFLMGAHSQQIVGRRYSPIQHGRNRVWALPSDSQLFSGFRRTTADRTYLACPYSSIGKCLRPKGNNYDQYGGSRVLSTLAGVWGWYPHKDSVPTKKNTLRSEGVFCLDYLETLITLVSLGKL